VGRRHDIPNIKDFLKPRGGPGQRHLVGEKDGARMVLNPMHLSDDELPLFDVWAQEHARIAGTKIQWWSCDPAGSERDPLYDEPILSKWAGPFNMIGVPTYPDSIAESRDEGFKVEFRGDLWVARKEFEDAGAPGPVEGDIVFFWKLPFFDQASVIRSDPKGAGYYYDVIQVGDDGHLFDGAKFVGFTFELKRNTIFTPERRLFDSQSDTGVCP
jgi:hypothetical protein